MVKWSERVQCGEIQPRSGDRLYKCFAMDCLKVFSEIDLVNKISCPHCGRTDSYKPMCLYDHLDCNHQVVAGLDSCPECGEPVCPECGAHDVLQISRVTGYMSDVTGWNAGKIQELRDRQRYDLALH